MAINLPTRRPPLSVKSRPKPAEDLYATAEKIAGEARLRAASHATDRQRTEARLAAVERGIATLRAELAADQAEHTALGQRLEELAILTDLGVAAPADAEAQRTRLTLLTSRLEQLRPQLATLEAEAARLTRERDDLARQEAEQRREAERALTTALATERAALLAEIDEARVRFMWAILRAGRWNRRHRLAGLKAHEWQQAKVKPISCINQETGKGDRETSAGVPLVRDFLNMTVEVDHLHHLLDADFAKYGLSGPAT